MGQTPELCHELAMAREERLLPMCLLAAAIFQLGKTQLKRLHLLRHHPRWETRVGGVLLLKVRMHGMSCTGRLGDLDLRDDEASVSGK